MSEAICNHEISLRDECDECVGEIALFSDRYLARLVRKLAYALNDEVRDLRSNGGEPSEFTEQLLEELIEMDIVAGYPNWQRG